MKPYLCALTTQFSFPTKFFFDSMEIVKSFLFLDRLFAMRRYVCRATPWARATKNVKKPQSQCESNLEKLDLKFWQNKAEIFLVFSHTFDSIVQNKFQQTNKTKINHIKDNHINIRFLYIFGQSGLLCARATINFVAKKSRNAFCSIVPGSPKPT